jgi:uncharacterized DUF497 family protein
MKPFQWSAEKNHKLSAERGITFEEMIVAIEFGGLLDLLDHPNTERDPRQQILVVAWNDDVYLVPYVEESDHFFLKTIFPSRKATRDDLNRDSTDAQAPT